MATKSTMSLLDPPPEKIEKSRVMAFTLAGLGALLLIVLFFVFRYYPEKRATEHFFNALVAGNTDQAYALWKPTGSYRKQDFLDDWGPTGYYGPVKSYKIMRAKRPRKSDVIAVTVAFSPYTPMPTENDPNSAKTKTVTLWISPGDKSISFAPPGE